MQFENVTAEEFAAAIKAANPSPVFMSQYSRYKPLLYDGSNGPDYRICRGDFILNGDFTAPGFCTAVLGKLTVSGFVDLCNSDQNGFDEGGIFVALGEVSCRAFANHYGKCAFIDGSLLAHHLVLNGYSDSALVVTDTIETFYFHDEAGWGSVGRDASLEYGVGYCLPIGYADAAREAIYPRHDQPASIRYLEKLYGAFPDNEKMLEYMRRGELPFTRT